MIKGNRVVLRNIIPSDLDVLLLWENDPLNHKFSETPSFYSREMMNDFVSSKQNIFINNQLRLMILLNKVPIGCVDLFDFDPFHLRAGVGVLIAAEYRNNGLAKESVLLLENYAFTELNLSQLYCNISVRNKKSVGLFKSCGYQISGELKSWIKTENSFDDVLFLQKINN
jgi:diamine N-acetyltransferase